MEIFCFRRRSSARWRFCWTKCIGTSFSPKYSLFFLGYSLILIVGRRVNVNFHADLEFPSEFSKQDAFIESLARRGSLFQADAEDFFIFTKGTFNWNELVNMVIGRPGYDNYLVNYVFYHRRTISFVDVTNAGRIDGNEA